MEEAEERQRIALRELVRESEDRQTELLMAIMNRLEERENVDMPRDTNPPRHESGALAQGPALARPPTIRHGKETELLH